MCDICKMITHFNFPYQTSSTLVLNTGAPQGCVLIPPTRHVHR